MAFHFPRNPRKSIYGEKYTKDHYLSFVFFATRSPTCSPSFIIPATIPNMGIQEKNPPRNTLKINLSVFPQTSFIFLVDSYLLLSPVRVIQHCNASARGFEPELRGQITGQGRWEKGM
jgi:hypothetical protein